MNAREAGAPIYLDHNATTPTHERVVEAMLPFFTAGFGNPSSDHAYGTHAARAITAARAQLARLLDASEDEIVFTASGSEANNVALKGVAYAHAGDRRKHFITSVVEHPAVLAPLAFLERRGHRVTRLPVDQHGLVDPHQVADAITDETVLVSIMHANNEVGTVQPIRHIAALAHERGVLVHTDAAQSVGKIPVSISELGVDLLSVAGHKLYAPKGVGALVVRRGLELEPLIHGAGHEHGRRAGTENTPYIVGLGTAAEHAEADLARYSGEVARLRDALHAHLLDALPDVPLNGHPTERLPNTLNVSFPGVDAAELMNAVRETIACSTGSACHAGRAEPSRVLQSMGFDAARASSALRLSLGLTTTAEEMKEASDIITRAVQTLRAPTLDPCA